MRLFSALTIAILFSSFLFVLPKPVQAQSVDFASLWGLMVSQNKAYQLLLAQHPELIRTTRPSHTPRPTKTPKPNSSSTPTPSANPTSTPSTQSQSIQDYLLNAVNDYRKSQGLSAVKSDPYTCGFAQTRANEIVTDFSHKGFDSRVASHSLPYPSY